MGSKGVWRGCRRIRAVRGTAPVRYEEGALGGIRRHWLLTAEWELAEHTRLGPAGETSRGTALEILDTEGGLWMLRSDENGEKFAWPTTPTRVWRQIVRLVLRRPT